MNNQRINFWLFILIFALIMLCVVMATIPVEGATEPTPTAPIISPTGTPDGNWINPVPWPTYDYPDPYPAPEVSPTPEAYPDDYHMAESKPFYKAEPGPEWELWAWIWDLFTH